MKSLNPFFSFAVFGVLLWAILPYSDAQVVAKPRLIPPPTQSGPNVKPETQSMIAAYARKALHSSVMNHRLTQDYRGKIIHVVGGDAVIALWTDAGDTIGDPKTSSPNGPSANMDFSIRVQVPKIPYVGFKIPLSTLKRDTSRTDIVFINDLSGCADPTGSNESGALSHTRVEFRWDSSDQLARVRLVTDKRDDANGKEQLLGYSELEVVIYIEVIDHNTKTRYIGRTACLPSLK